MKKLLSLVLLCLISNGCIYVLEGKGEIGFKQQSTWSFYHSTELDEQNEQKSKAELKGTFFDWLFNDGGVSATSGTGQGGSESEDGRTINGKD